MRMPAFVILILVFAGSLAGAAAAQEARRDPFRPLVTESGGAGAVAPASGQVATIEPVEPAPPSERLADTGDDPFPWIAIAYVLLALGAGALVVHRMGRPSYLVR